MKWLVLFLIVSLPLPAWSYWSCAWPYRTQITVQENSGGTLTDYQIKIDITGAVLNSGYAWTSDGFDLRIVDSDDLTQLEHWVETWDQSGETATVWVKLDTLLANENKTLYIYYGNEFADPLANIPFTFVEPGIKFHTRNSTGDPDNLTEAFSLFDIAGDGTPGYGCTFITDFTGVNNRNTFGAQQNFIAYSETFFEVQAGEEGTWGVRYGADFGRGGGLYVNSTPLEEDWLNDLWWSNNWGNSDVLQGTIDLTEGYHKLEVIGAEGCCDGGITVQFQKPGGSWTTYSTANIDIRSRACPATEPTITFGAQATATCPSPLASYRLDEGGWSTPGDVIDQTGSYPGTMLGTVNEIADTQVCGGAEVAPNNLGSDVSAIQTGLDLDGDVGPVGSIAFWINLNNDWNDGLGRKIFDASLLPTGSVSERYFFVDKLAGGNFDFRFEDSADGDFQILEPTGANRLANQWYHITVTFDFPNNSFQIYVDETLVANTLVNLNGNPPITTGAVTALNTLQFGDKIPSPNLGGSGRSADGVYDEINIFNSVLSISEIRGLMAKTRNCPPTVLPRACLGSFPNAVNSIRNRIINFGENAQIIGNPDNVLSARTINKTAFSTLLTCDTADCITGDDEVNDVGPSNFQRTNANNDVTVFYLGNTTIGASTDEFDVVTVNFLGTLNTDNSVYSEFYIDELIANSSSEINFAPGTYWINDLTLGSGAVINVLDGGPVRLYINDVVSWSSDVVINSPGVGQPGNADELLMYFYSQANFGYRPTLSGAVFVTQDIDTNQEGRIYGLVTGENVTLGLNTQVHYDVNAYYGMTDITWCDNGSATIDSFNISSASTAVNCLPTAITIQVLDASGALIPDYEGTITLSTDTSHGDWSTDGTANGVLDNGTADDGAATYGMLASDLGEVTLYFKNTHPETTQVTFESEGVVGNVSIDFTAFGFVFSTIPTQVSGQTSGNISLSAVETDLVTGACQALLINNQTVDMAVECLSPNNCGTATDTVASSNVPTNPISNVTSYNGVSLNFGDASSYSATLTNTYSDAGSIRLWARYELLDANGSSTGNFISGSSNGFVNTPAGFCIESSEANWSCTTPGLTASCTAFKQAGDNFNLVVTAKDYNGGSTDFCSNNTTVNFSNTVDVSHNLISPTTLNGGQAGSFSATNVSLVSGTSSTVVNLSEMGVFTVSAGGNTYLGATLPENDSDNIGRFYPKDFNIVSTTAASYNNGYAAFTYIGQVDGIGDGVIDYAVSPTFTFVARGFNDQVLNNYLTPFNSVPVLSVSASSTTLGADSITPLSVTGNYASGTISGPDVSDQFTYTFNSSDHFVFNRDANSMVGEFSNNIRHTLTDFIEPIDGVTFSSGSDNTVINGSGGPIRYGRLNLLNAYGPETESLPQIIRSEYFDGSNFITNNLDSDTSYNVTSIGTINVINVGDASNPLLDTDSTASGFGQLGSGEAIFNWTPTLGGRYGTYRFPFTVDAWLQFDWDGNGSQDDPSGEVTFGQYRGHDRVIYWKEINY